MLNGFYSVTLPKLITLAAIALYLGQFLAQAPSALAAEDSRSVEEIIDEAQKAFNELKSWSADIEMNTVMGGMRVSATGTVLGSGRSQVMDLNIDMMGQLGRVKTVYDSQGVQWTETDVMGQLSIIKLDTTAIAEATGKDSGQDVLTQNPTMPQNITNILENAADLYDLELKGIGTSDSMEVYLFEGPILDGAMKRADPTGFMASRGVTFAKTRISVGVSDGFIRKSEVIGKDGTVIVSIAFSNFKANPDLDADAFTYKPPEGVPFLDMTDATIQRNQAVGSSRL